MKDIFNIVKKNLEISKLYLNLYPPLKRHEDLSKKKKLTQKEFDEQSDLWNQLIKLKVHTISNFLWRVRGNQKKYLTGESTADPIKVIKDIKREINKELKSDQCNLEYQYYDSRHHMEMTQLKAKWKDIKTKEDLFKIIISGGQDYTSWDYCAFGNRRGELINIAIKNNLKVKDTYALDIDDGLDKLLKIPSKDKSIKDQIQFDKDQKEIESIIKILIPICERAKKSDSCWENNFFNNKILSKVKQQLK